MIRFFACLSLALWSVGAALPAWAHRVNIFAYVDGNEIVVESSFSRSQKVKQGKIEVRDAATTALAAEGNTDDAGVFRFAVTPEMRESGHDLLVRIVAGEGHQNDWTIAAAEFAAVPSVAAGAPAATPTPASPAVVGTSASGAARPDASASDAPTSGVSTPTSAQPLSAADVERIVNSALDAKLAPLKHALASQVEAGPSFKDIIGGIGWIFGLVGVAAYFRRRP